MVIAASKHAALALRRQVTQPHRNRQRQPLERLRAGADWHHHGQDGDHAELVGGDDVNHHAAAVEMGRGWCGTACVCVIVGTAHRMDAVGAPILTASSRRASAILMAVSASSRMRLPTASAMLPVASGRETQNWAA